MRIYKAGLTKIIAKQGNWHFEIARADLPADPAEALAFLWQKYEAAQVVIDPETGEPIEPEPPPEPHPELDVDDEAVETADFEALAAKAAAEIAWLEETTPTIDDPVLRRIAQENREMLKAWRYVIRRLK
jgi:hypothetical protein